MVGTPEELTFEFDRLSKRADFMVQEIISGDDGALWSYFAFWDGAGVERGWVTSRKLCQNPPGFGAAALRVTVDAPEVTNLSRRLLETLDYRGLVCVEFKYDRRDSSYRLMEINPRLAASSQIAISAGVDLPWLAYRYLTVGEETSAPPFAVGVKWMNEVADLTACLALRRSGGITFRSWLRSLRGVSSLAIWARDDPKPFLRSVYHLLRRALRVTRSRMIDRARRGRDRKIARSDGAPDG